MKLSETSLVHRGSPRPRPDHNPNPIEPEIHEQSTTLFSRLRQSGGPSQIDHRKKTNNRKSLDLTPRKIHDIQSVANKVKKSFSFDEPCVNAATNSAVVVEDKKPVRVVRLGATYENPVTVEPTTFSNNVQRCDKNAPVKCISVIDDIDCDIVRGGANNQESRKQCELLSIGENSASDTSYKYLVNSDLNECSKPSEDSETTSAETKDFVLNLKSTVVGYFSKRLVDSESNQNNSTTGRSVAESKNPAESPTGIKAALSGYFDKVLSEESRRRIFGGEKAVKGSQVSTGLRKDLCRDRRGRSGSRAGLRCRSSPPPPPSVCPGGGEGSAGGRLCRTWYGGYGTLTEDGDTFAEQNPPGVVAGLSGAGCGGGRRRADARRRRLPLDHPHHPPSAAAAARLSASTVSLNILPRISAAVIPLRRKDRADADLSKSAAPLLQRENSAPVLNMNSPTSPLTPQHLSTLKRTDFSKSAAPLIGLQMDDPFASGMSGMRKCETVSGFSGFEPQRAVNRLRPGGVCSRCSSLLSLAASGSRYSLGAAGGFVAVTSVDEETLLCKLCLEDVPSNEVTNIEHCGCSFCTKCMQAYAEYEIVNGAYDISCPDSGCQRQGVMRPAEVEALVPLDLVDKHRKFRLNHEVAMDGCRAFCPRAGCETVCRVTGEGAGPVPGIGAAPPQPVRCPTCAHHFCSACTNQWHVGMDCAAYSRHLALEAGLVGGLSGGDAIAAGLPAESDLIKWCPMCRVPIEKDEGCAQMMCKRCKHVFCWYCLASLDDDFLLRHYDKGPCKNKLGHSRASVIWHRAQVVGIFAGFGLLLLVASPLLLLAAPCIVCCKCRLCNSNEGKTIDGDEPEGMDLEGDDFPEDNIQRITAVPID